MRWINSIFVLTLVMLQLELWLSADRIPGLHQLEQEVAAQLARNENLRQRNADYSAEIESLEEGRDAAEERARAKLGLVLPDETFFQLAQ